MLSYCSLNTLSAVYLDLMIIDMLYELRLSRNNYGRLAQMQNLHKAAWSAVSYHDPRIFVEFIHLNL